MAQNLQELIDVVHETFHCDEEVYWKLGHLPKERWDNEIISHSSRHLSKSAGKLASICENYEHGEAFDEEAARNVVLNSTSTVLKIAAMLGMSAEDILKGVPEYVGYTKSSDSE